MILYINSYITYFTINSGFVKIKILKVYTNNVKYNFQQYIDKFIA